MSLDVHYHHGKARYIDTVWLMMVSRERNGITNEHSF